MASTTTMLERRRGFYEKLQPDVRETILKHEAAGTIEDPEYEQAMDLFHLRYTCRLDPWPDWLNRTVSAMDVEANTAMWGPPNSATPAPLADWDVRPRLGRIDTPTLVVAGRHDGLAAGQEQDIHAGIPNSELVVFEESSHYPFAEERERFLARVESQIRP